MYDFPEAEARRADLMWAQLEVSADSDPAQLVEVARDESQPVAFRTRILGHLEDNDLPSAQDAYLWIAGSDTETREVRLSALQWLDEHLCQWTRRAQTHAGSPMMGLAMMAARGPRATSVDSVPIVGTAVDDRALVPPVANLLPAPARVADAEREINGCSAVMVSTTPIGPGPTARTRCSVPCPGHPETSR